MNARIVLAACLLAMAGGCATDPMSAEAPRDVSPEGRATYWLPQATTITTSSRVKGVQRGRAVATLVVVQYSIDSSGKVRDAKVLRAEPSAADSSWALAAVRAFSFVPTKENAARQPIRTQHEVTLD